MTAITYPYPPGKITVREAAQFVASVVYPDDDKSTAQKRVRERIRYAMKTGKLKKSTYLVAADFFRWAIESNPQWAALVKVRNLPHIPVVLAPTEN
jgi:hypothetical protein